MKIKILCISLTVLLGCTSINNEKEHNGKEVLPLELTHATNFTITIAGSHKIVEVLKPWQGASKSIKYRLIPKKEKSSNENFTETVIYTPVDNIVCTSTTHLAPLDMLGVSNSLIGFPSTQYVSSSIIKEQVQSGQTKELGK